MLRQSVAVDNLAQRLVKRALPLVAPARGDAEVPGEDQRQGPARARRKGRSQPSASCELVTQHAWTRPWSVHPGGVTARSRRRARIFVRSSPPTLRRSPGGTRPAPNNGPARKKVYAETRALRRELRDFEVERGSGRSRPRTWCSPPLRVPPAGSCRAFFRRARGGRPGGSTGRHRQAAQALEVECWIAMLCGRRVVLAGDHCQLPPGHVARREPGFGLAASIDSWGGQRGRPLGPHFLPPPALRGVLCNSWTRSIMHEAISQWASKESYGGASKRTRVWPTVLAFRACGTVSAGSPRRG